MFLNIMFYAPMGRFQLESKLKLPLILGFTGLIQLVLLVPVGLLSLLRHRPAWADRRNFDNQ